MGRVVDKMQSLAIAISALFVAAVVAAATPKGHLDRLGTHQPPVGELKTVTEWPDAQSFYKEHMQASVPLVVRGGAKMQPAFELWTDEYLTENYGEELVEVEEGKKEDRDKGLWTWNLETFLKKYKGDMYSVSAVPKAMRHEYLFPRSVNCRAFTKRMDQLNHWFSSGGTVSVLHKDNFENINCLLDGKKELLFFDKKLSVERLHWDHRQNHGHSKVDADRVDMLKYPGFEGLEYWRVNMVAGDCIYIPAEWYHQVRSGSPGNRNYGLNLWFEKPPASAVKKCSIKEPKRMAVGEAYFRKEEFPEGVEDGEYNGDRDET